VHLGVPVSHRIDHLSPGSGSPAGKKRRRRFFLRRHPSRGRVLPGCDRGRCRRHSLTSPQRANCQRGMADSRCKGFCLRFKSAEGVSCVRGNTKPSEKRKWFGNPLTRGVFPPRDLANAVADCGCVPHRSLLPASEQFLFCRRKNDCPFPCRLSQNVETSHVRPPDTTGSIGVRPPCLRCEPGLMTRHDIPAADMPKVASNHPAVSTTQVAPRREATDGDASVVNRCLPSFVLALAVTRTRSPHATGALPSVTVKRSACFSGQGLTVATQARPFLSPGAWLMELSWSPGCP